MKKIIWYKKPLYGYFRTDLTLCEYCGFVSDSEAWGKNKCCCPKCDHDVTYAVTW